MASKKGSNQDNDHSHFRLSSTMTIIQNTSKQKHVVLLAAVILACIHNMCIWLVTNHHEMRIQHCYPNSTCRLLELGLSFFEELPSLVNGWSSSWFWIIQKHQIFPNLPKNTMARMLKYISGWWFQPIWKVLYSQNGHLPQIGMKIQKYVKPPPRYLSSQHLWWNILKNCCDCK